TCVRACVPACLLPCLPPCVAVCLPACLPVCLSVCLSAARASVMYITTREPLPRSCFFLEERGPPHTRALSFSFDPSLFPLFAPHPYLAARAGDTLSLVA
ncbi:hypothetical protein X777_08901, partial [Ooceraea biroi]